MTLSIVVRFSFPGVHSWPGAPAGPEQYLAYPHRHVFHVEAVKRVAHTERAIEFIGLKQAMFQYVQEANFAGPHNMSCETMAELLLKQFELLRCSVCEDGENGSEVTQGDEVDIAYLAGILDGEGCFSASMTGRSTPHFSVSVTMAHKSTIESLHAAYGGTLYPVKQRAANHALLWNWAVSGRTCQVVSTAVLPYLRIKREQCLLVLALVELTDKYARAMGTSTKSTGTPRTTKDLVLGARIVERLQTLNMSKGGHRD